MTITYYEDIRIGVQVMGVVEGEKTDVQEALILLKDFLQLAIQVMFIVISVRDGIKQIQQDLRELKQAYTPKEVSHLFLFLRVAPSLCLILIGAFICECGLKQ